MHQTGDSNRVITSRQLTVLDVNGFFLVDTLVRS